MSDPIVPPDRALHVVLIVALAAVGWLVRPFNGALLVAAVAAILAWPAHAWVIRMVRGRRGLATTITVLGVTVGVLAPASGLAVVVSREIVALVNEVARVLQGGAWTGWVEKIAQGPVMAWIAEQAGGTEALTETARQALQRALLGIASLVSGSVADLASVTAFAVLRLTVFYIALTTLLLRGERLTAWLRKLSPLHPAHTGRLLDVFAQFARNVVLAGLVGGVVQGIVAGIGYGIAGIDRPLLFAVLTGVLAYVPVVGTAMAWVPLTVLLLAQGRPEAALFVTIWSLAVTASVDNFVKPLIVRGRSDVPTLLIFLGVFGGLSTFGVIGLLVGPVLVAMLLALLRIYAETLPDREGG